MSSLKVACLLLLTFAAPQLLLAQVVITTDQFNDTGGIPGGWSLGFGDGSVTEGGGYVTITDTTASPTVIVASQTFNPQGTTTTGVVQVHSITATDSFRGYGVGFADTVNNRFNVSRGLDGRLVASAAWNNGANSGSFEFLNVPKFTADETLTFTTQDSGYQIVVGSYNSGLQAWTTIFDQSNHVNLPNLAALGTSMSALVLGDSGHSGQNAESSGTTTVEIDSFTLSVAELVEGGGGGSSSIPEPSSFAIMSLASVLLVARRRRDQKSANSESV